MLSALQRLTLAAKNKREVAVVEFVAAYEKTWNNSLLPFSEDPLEKNLDFFWPAFKFALTFPSLQETALNLIKEIVTTIPLDTNAAKVPFILTCPEIVFSSSTQYALKAMVKNTRSEIDPTATVYDDFVATLGKLGNAGICFEALLDSHKQFEDVLRFSIVHNLPQLAQRSVHIGLESENKIESMCSLLKLLVQLSQTYMHVCLELLHGIVVLSPSALDEIKISALLSKEVTGMLLSSTTSSSEEVFRLSVSITLKLANRQFHALKLSLAVLLPLQISILLMPTSSLQHRISVLQAYATLTSQTLANIYLNFDCDLGASSVFEDMVVGISKLLQTKLTKDEKRAALEATDNFSRAMLSWSLKDAVVMEEIKSQKQEIRVSLPPDDMPYEKLSAQKQLLKQAIAKFNIKPSKGIAFLIENGLIEQNKIAKFLLDTSGISKSAIGEYIGEGDEANIKVMHEFIRLLEFNDMGFVPSLRYLLQQFRLPGESQKIDRIMEAFASRFCENNPSVFANADTAYTLAYSVIMLNTDLHSLQVKHKMDKSAFIKNNRGINNNGNLPDNLLSDIFDDIKKEEIVLEEEQIRQVDTGKGENFNVQEKKYLYELETVRPNLIKSVMQKKSKHQLKGQQLAPFAEAKHHELVRLMLAAVWNPLLAALNVVFDSISDSAYFFAKDDEAFLLKCCLDSIANCFKITCIFNISVEREAFLSTLVKLNRLWSLDSSKPTVYNKNVCALLTLLLVVNERKEDLEKTNWATVFASVVKLLKVLDYRNRTEFDLNRGNLSELLWNQELLISSDAIFHASSKLTFQSILKFFVQLVEACTVEAKMGSHMVLLEKLVAAAYYNMTRIRLEWTAIWKILHPFFTEFGCSEDSKISSLVIDALRQITLKYLERDELSKYSAQNELLKPLETIMQKNHSPLIQDLVVISIRQMMATKAENIRSGWKTIFLIYSRIANAHYKKETQDKGGIVEATFDQVYSVVKRHIEHVKQGEGMVDLVGCLGEFACSNEEIALKAIDLLNECADSVADDWGQLHSIKDSSSESFFILHLALYQALLKTVTTSTFEKARINASKTIFALAQSHSDLYDSTAWNSIFKSCIFPIWHVLFEETAFASPSSEEPQSPIVGINEATLSVWVHSLRYLLDLFYFFIQAMTAKEESLLKEKFMKDNIWLVWLNDILHLLRRISISKSNLRFAKAGINCFYMHIVGRCGSLLTLDESRPWALHFWESVTSTHTDIIVNIAPLDDDFRCWQSFFNATKYFSQLVQPVASNSFLRVIPSYILVGGWARPLQAAFIALNQTQSDKVKVEELITVKAQIYNCLTTCLLHGSFRVGSEMPSAPKYKCRPLAPFEINLQFTSSNQELLDSCLLWIIQENLSNMRRSILSSSVGEHRNLTISVWISNAISFLEQVQELHQLPIQLPDFELFEFCVELLCWATQVRDLDTMKLVEQLRCVLNTLGEVYIKNSIK